MAGICEACESCKAEIVEPCDESDELYIVCRECHRRLHALALRPLEWFNLSKRHGWWPFLLHDDFYLEDGSAQQPEEGVETPNQFPAPTLAHVCHDPEALLNYSITRWQIDVETAAAWRSISRVDVLSTIMQRFASTGNAGIRSTILRICGIALKESGADFVRLAWNHVGEKTPIESLAIASAKCLPDQEGFDRVVSALATCDSRQKLQRMWCLGNFHTTQALDWIETNIAEPITETWGYLAAASKFDWPRAEKWLDGGRPLSLVALDTLLAIARPMSPFLREYAPSIIEPPLKSRYVEVLSSHRQRDPVPRVEKRTTALFAYFEKLCQKS